MRILIFNWRDLSHPWAGGAEVFLFETARRWVRQGHSVTWICGRHRQQASHSTQEGIEIIRRGGTYLVYLQAAAYYLTTALAGRGRAPFDVILDSANGIPFFTPLFSRLPKVIMVHHVHREVFFQEMPRLLAHAGCWMETVAMPFLCRRTPFLTVSESSKAALVKLGLAAPQISIVYNGVDHNIYRPGEKGQHPLIAYVGRLRNYKSLPIAIQAMPAILRSIPGARLVIAGSGEAQSRLQQMAREAGIAEQVQFLGYISQVEKVRLLQQAQVVVNPSMKEGWGISVIEANACATPVVGSDVCGLCDSILDGETGLLFPYGDSEALADRLIHLLQDSGERARLSANALDWSQHFNWECTAEETLSVLSGLNRGIRIPAEDPGWSVAKRYENL